MGFRSTLCSEHYSGNLPKWFKAKYENTIHFHKDSILVTSKTESKYYTNSFFEDYRKALIEIDFWNGFDEAINIAVLAEDGYISKVTITEEGIKYYWADEFTESNRVWRQG